jgi:enamine deaminase RidA (YjgF/YER057c/UK114 family)
VDIKDIASLVYFDLDSIEVEEVWDRSGRTRNGYVEPTEMAFQMFEEALEPFLEEMKKYLKLSMFVEAKEYCMGILRGI